MSYFMSRADLSGVETVIERGDKPRWLLFLRDIKRQDTDPRTVCFRVCDEEGREVEWDDVPRKPTPGAEGTPNPKGTHV